MFIDFRASGAPSNRSVPRDRRLPLPLRQGKNDLVTGGPPQPAERCVHASESEGGTSGSLPPEPCRGDTDLAVPRVTLVWAGTEEGPSIQKEGGMSA